MCIYVYIPLHLTTIQEFRLQIFFPFPKLNQCREGYLSKSDAHLEAFLPGIDISHVILANDSAHRQAQSRWLFERAVAIMLKKKNTHTTRNSAQGFCD